MVKLYLDTLVFGLQKRGGVSVVWYEYIRRLLKEPLVELTLLDINGSYVNTVFQELDTSKAFHVRERGKNLQVLRNRKPRLPEEASGGIFQSTYLRTCKKPGIKNVIMIHDFTHQKYFKGIKRWLNTFQKWRSVHNADGIICVSENTRKDLLQFFPFCKNKYTTVIYNSASDIYKVVREPYLPERYRELEGKKYFIYVGDRFPYKNTGFLFRLLRETSKLHCVLIGGAELSVQEKQDIMGLEKRIHHFTRVSDEDLNLLYNCAFCMIYPSLYEGFGIPVLEAMKSGCPVIAFHNSSIPEVLRGTGILLENDDYEGCLRALGKLADSDYREELVKAEVKAAEFFDWETSYFNLLCFYQKIIAKPESSSHSESPRRG